MRHIIFDFDGTIADTFPVALEIGESLIGRKVKEDVEVLKNMTVRDLMKLYNVSMHEVPRMAIQAKILLTKKMNKVLVIEGMPEVIKELCEKGHTLHVVSSNKASNIDNFFRKYKINEYFSSVQGNVGVFGKARALNKVIKRQKIKKNDCLYIGDEARDIEGAKKVGIKVISVTWGFNGQKILSDLQPLAVVTKPKQILSIIDSLK